MAAIEAGKHVLCEKPVAYDYRDVRRAAELARSKGLKTKVGLTFRYSPAMRYMKDLVDRGDIGTPYIYNAYEQNSQWIEPADAAPAGRARPTTALQVASLEGYGAPVIDIGHWLIGSDMTAVVGACGTSCPSAMVADTGQMMRTNIDDGDIFIGEFANGAIGSVQSSFVTVGNYPGIEVRVYGSRGRGDRPPDRGVRHLRDVQEARPDDVEFREIAVPGSYYPAGGSPREAWETLFYANLTADFASEVLGDDRGQRGQLRRRRCGSRRSSTRSRSRSASAAGSPCRWTRRPPSRPPAHFMQPVRRPARLHAGHDAHVTDRAAVQEGEGLLVAGAVMRRHGRLHRVEPDRDDAGLWPAS